ncbi:MAG: class I SAM-dependent methyltransferase [Bryobacteraceae bacterium]
MEESRFRRTPPTLAGIAEATVRTGFPMASEPRTGALLRVLAAAKPGGHLLELGTGTGFGTAWLLDGMDRESTLVSVDIDEAVQGIARNHLGQDARLTLVTGGAIEFLLEQPQRSFDLVFADAMPGKYDRLDLSLGLVKRGGFFVIDDMLPQPNWPAGHEALAGRLLETLAADPDFESVPMAWASGVVVAVRQRE